MTLAPGVTADDDVPPGFFARSTCEMGPLPIAPSPSPERRNWSAPRPIDSAPKMVHNTGMRLPKKVPARFFVTDRGEEPVRTWLKKLDPGLSRRPGRHQVRTENWRLTVWERLARN